MRLRLSLDSRVYIDLRATGVLGALAHSPTLVARPDVLDVVAEGDALDVELEARVPASAVEPPGDIPARDCEKMRENLLGRQVLDASRFPTLVFRGRYAGSLAGGTLTGQLDVRGAPRRVSIPVALARRNDHYVATGVWEGKLTDLGVAPFKALLGAIRLEDWIRLRLHARFAEIES
jgi:polyisoprenoid-binding protein YceI